MQSVILGSKNDDRARSRSPAFGQASQRGYITLSPRCSRLKSTILPGGEINEHEKDEGRIRERKQTKNIDTQNGQTDEKIVVRTEKPFKPIPKFDTKDIKIKTRRENNRSEFSERSVSRKRKIEVTRVSVMSGKKQDLGKLPKMIYQSEYTPASIH